MCIHTSCIDPHPPTSMIVNHQQFWTDPLPYLEEVVYVSSRSIIFNELAYWPGGRAKFDQLKKLVGNPLQM